MSMRLLGFFSSLRLTIVLLALSMMLVFMATLAQMQLGIWEVMDRYIRTFVVWVPVGDRNAPVFPGGLAAGRPVACEPNRCARQPFYLDLEKGSDRHDSRRVECCSSASWSPACSPEKRK